MATKVNCTVNTCTYWGQGNECSANNILVQSEQGQSGASSDSSMTSSVGSALNMSSTPAYECKETQCRTFKKK